MTFRKENHARNHQRTWFSAALLALLLSGCGGSDDNSNATADDDAGGDDSVATTVQLTQIGRYQSGVFGEGASEIVAHDPASQRLFVINAQAATVDVLSIADPSQPDKIGTISAVDNWPAAKGINSVSVANGLVALAVENTAADQPGRVQFYNASDLSFRSQVAVGVLPDMVTFSHDGQTVMVANEGQPLDDYSVDPEGSVTIVNLSDPASPVAQQVTFTAFNQGQPRHAELPQGARVLGNFNPTALEVVSFTDSDPATLTLTDVSALTTGDFFTLASSEGDPLPYRVASVNSATATVTLTGDFDGDSEVSKATAAGLTVYLHDGESSVAQDLEPEYIAFAPDDGTAWVTLQENNAVAVIDVAAATVDRILALGTKDHALAGNGLDASKEGTVNIRNWPVLGYYMPDSIAAYQAADGQVYYVTANEGDAREYDAYVEEVDISDIGLDPDSFSDAATLAADTALGGLATSVSVLTADPAADPDGDGLLDRLYAFGGRSFSIWSGASGERVFDSGDDFETLTAERFGADFNNDNDENDPDGRSDNKGPEPEAITVGEVQGRQYAFIGLERIGGVMVYDVSAPGASVFVSYTNNRDFSVDIKQIEDGVLAAGAAGDLGPESVLFIPASQAPNGETPLLVVGNEVSGTTTLYRVESVAAP